jgi:hypothetical protein
MSIQKRFEKAWADEELAWQNYNTSIFRKLFKRKLPNKITAEIWYKIGYLHAMLDLEKALVESVKEHETKNTKKSKRV